MYCFIPQTMETVKQTFQKSAHPGNSKGSLSLRSAEREAAGDPSWRPPSWMLSRAIPGREPSNLHPHPRAMSVSGCLGCVRVGSDGISAVLTSFGVSQQTPFANFQVFIREFTVGGKRHRHHHQQQQQQKREGAYFCRFVNQKVWLVCIQFFHRVWGSSPSCILLVRGGQRRDISFLLDKCPPLPPSTPVHLPRQGACSFGGACGHPVGDLKNACVAPGWGCVWRQPPVVTLPLPLFVWWTRGARVWKWGRHTTISHAITHLTRVSSFHPGIWRISQFHSER